MAKRTVKQGAIRSKKMRMKSKEKQMWKFVKYRKLTFEQAKELGVIESRNVPLGEEPNEGDYYFRKRRKLNWVTRRKCNNNGIDFYGNKY